MKPKISKAAFLELIVDAISGYDLSDVVELREGKNDKMFAYGFAVAPKQTLTFDGETLHSRQVQIGITFQDVKTSEFAVKTASAPASKAATISLADLRAKLQSKGQ